MENQIVLGPGGNRGLLMTPALSDLLRSHNRYQANLPLWDQYLIWRYTLGSGAVTRRLVGVSSVENDILWTYYFFKSYNVKHYGLGAIGYPYQRYNNLFQNPKEYLKLSQDQKISIFREILEQYPKDLERLILNSPPTEEEIIVYKVSRPYPDLPLNQPEEAFKDGFEVYQKPFNSTTYDPQFNFLPFLGEDPCCIYTITIPACSRILAISPILHAYPHEREILLPFGTTLEIKETFNVILNTIPLENQRFIEVQRPPLVIGEVYRIDPEACSKIQARKIKMFIADILTPYRSCPRDQ